MHAKTIKKIFDSLRHEEYAVIKFDQNTLGKRGRDVDIYCKDLSKVSKKILQVGNLLLEEGVLKSIKITEEKNQKHAHIDFFDESFIFRFDLYGKLPEFQSIKVRKDIFDHSLADRTKKIIVENNLAYEIFVPTETLDLVLRYAEFLEYYPERQSKIKHLNHVTHAIADEKKHAIFSSALSTYVSKRRYFKRKLGLVLRKFIGFTKRALQKLIAVFIEKRKIQE